VALARSERTTPTSASRRCLGARGLRAVLFDPWCDGSYTRFIHASYRDNGRADVVNDPDRENEWGAEYGPYLISRFTTRDHSDLVFYFVMSTWSSPYNAVLMRAKLRVDPWDGFELAKRAARSAVLMCCTGEENSTPLVSDCRPFKCWTPQKCSE
jgi:hypothetical protein